MDIGTEGHLPDEEKPTFTALIERTSPKKVQLILKPIGLYNSLYNSLKIVDLETRKPLLETSATTSIKSIYLKEAVTGR